MPDKPPFGELAKQVCSPLLWARKADDVRCVGSLYVIAIAGHQALAITAKHCIEHLRRESGFNDLQEMMISPMFRRPAGLSVSPTGTGPGIEAPWEGAVFTHISTPDSVAQIIGFEYIAHDALDLALLTLRMPGLGVRFPVRARIQSRGPKVGDEVAMFGFADQGLNSVKICEDGSVRSVFSLQDQTRVGSVTEVFNWNEHHLLRSPGFSVNKEVNSGLSGGPVFLLQDADGPVAVGMISASGNGDTVASILWPILSLANPLPPTEQTSSEVSSLLGLCQIGAIEDLSEAHLKLRFREGNPYGDPNEFGRWIE